VTPATLDLTIRRGITFGPLVLTFNGESNADVDLNDWNVYAEARRISPGQSTDNLDLEPEITSEEGGQVTISFTDTETLALPYGTYEWDLVLEQPTGERIGPFLAGKLTIEDIVTQP